MLWANEQRTGTTIRVRSVASPSPKITATAMGPHHCDDSPPISNGQLAKVKTDTGGHGKEPQDGRDGRQ